MSLDFDADDMPQGFAGVWDIAVASASFSERGRRLGGAQRISDGLTNSQRHYRRHATSPQWRRAQQARNAAYLKRPEVHARRMELQRQRRAR
jgi:hypothetical protein